MFIKGVWFYKCNTSGSHRIRSISLFIGDSWTDEAIEVFEELSYSAQWKVIMARTVNYSQSESKAIPCVQLIDTNGEKVREN